MRKCAGHSAGMGHSHQLSDGNVLTLTCREWVLNDDAAINPGDPFAPTPTLSLPFEAFRARFLVRFLHSKRSLSSHFAMKARARNKHRDGHWSNKEGLVRLLDPYRLWKNVC